MRTRSSQTGESGVALPTLFIADDNPALLEMLVSILEREFSIVGTVSSGKGVLDEVPILKPDIILLDVALGDMTGFYVADRLNKTGSKARIIFVSVHESVSFIQAAQGMGASGYIFKSQISRDLLNALRDVSKGTKFISSAPEVT